MSDPAPTVFSTFILNRSCRNHVEVETMKALVATRATQGQRASDCMECVDGELLWMTDVCPYSRAHPDGECPCGRSFRGLASDGATTTAVIRDVRGLTREHYVDALRSCIDCNDECSCIVDTEGLVDAMLALARNLPDGAVIERRVDVLKIRTVNPLTT